MQYPRLLLFPLGDGGDDEERLGGALDVARVLEAHLRVMHTALEPQALLPRDVAVPGTVLADLEAAFDQHATRDNDRLQSMFSEICRTREISLNNDPSNGTTASWFEARGVRSALVARFGKLADWVVVSRPRAGRATASLQAALMDTGRPVLVLPRRLESFDVGTVMIAWNGGPQCVRATSAALRSVLPRASRVLVAATREVEATGPRVAEVARYLHAHGIGADTRLVECKPVDTGQALLQTAAEEQVSLLVMGAYGSHKVRDLMLGSVTAHVLEECPVPMLMAN